MFWFNLCPRCNGDLFEDRDQFGSFITCMQCGFGKDVSANTMGTFIDTAEPVPVPVAAVSDGGKRRRISQCGRHFSKTFDKPFAA